MSRFVCIFAFGPLKDLCILQDAGLARGADAIAVRQPGEDQL